jgi:TonB-linked SusC/RagA family outer membrane protein
MMKKKKKIAFKSLLYLCFMSFFLICRGNVEVFAGSEKADSQQQTERTVKGKVTDAKGESLIGVSVAVQGANEGTVTNVDGQYSVRVPNNAVLVFKYLGYKNVTVTANKDVINVTMDEDTQALSEVVVVGYGTQKKENLTGAVASVDVAKTLDGRAIPDAGRGLQGTTPGLSIVLPSAEVGEDAVIRIRGQFASFQGTSNPLILLDNVEIPSISLVNPDDIESISILKDAGSAAIYGSKAANGVVLITTKKGSKTGKSTISYSGNISWQNAAKRYEMGGVEALEFAWLAAKANDPGTTRVGAFYMITEDVVNKAKEWQKNYGGTIGVNDPTVYGRDWTFDGSYKYGYRTYDPYDYLIAEWAPTQTHNVSASGVSGKTTYNVGLGYLDQSGMNKVAKADKFQRYTGSIRLTSEINKFITVNAGAMYSQREKQYAYTTTTNIDPWYYLYRWGPQYPLGVDENGYDIRSPWSEFKQANTASMKWNYTNFNVGALLNFTKDWTLKFDYTHTNQEYINTKPGFRFTAADSWVAAVARNDASGNPVYVNNKGEVVNSNDASAMRAYNLNYQTYTGAGTALDGMYRRATNRADNTINAYTTYNLNLNADNIFKFMAGMNMFTTSTEWQSSERRTLSNLENPQFNFATGDQYVGGDVSDAAQLGYFGRLNYAYKSKYLLEGNLRYDGTSKFPADLQWRWFPSVSAGWLITEETFAQPIKPVLSSFKLRASYGIVGDQTVPGSLYIPTMSNGQLSYLDGSTLLNYVSVPGAVSNTITWQDFETTDVGFDARFLKNEIGLTFDWYRRNTKNALVGMEGVTNTYGTSAPLVNTALLRTDGWEISIDFNHRFTKDFSINGMFTLSDAVTKIIEYGPSRTVTGWYNGKTYGEIWGYRTDRLYQESDFEHDADGNLIMITLDESHGKLNAGKKAYKLKGDNPVYQAYLQSGNFYFQPGDVKFKDLDGDGQIGTGDNTVENPGDREVIGNETPRYEYGFRLGADYKGFDFSIFFQGVGKRDIWGSSGLTLAGFNTSDGAIAKALCTDYWTPENTDAFYPRPFNLANSTDVYGMRVQDRYLLNMAYLRLKNITLGYTVPIALTKKAMISKARFYVAAENLLTWDNLNGLPVDPEIIPGYSSYFATSGNNYQAGRAGLGTPAFKNISVGIQLNF